MAPPHGSRCECMRHASCFNASIRATLRAPGPSPYHSASHPPPPPHNTQYHHSHHMSCLHTCTTMVAPCLSTHLLLRLPHTHRLLFLQQQPCPYCCQGRRPLHLPFTHLPAASHHVLHHQRQKKKAAAARSLSRPPPCSRCPHTRLCPTTSNLMGWGPTLLPK